MDDIEPIDYLPSLRHEYVSHGLRRSELDPDPVRQFQQWFTAAVEAGIRDVNAMTLATATRDGRPSARIVLLKGSSRDGFTFFTNYESAKARELAETPRGSLCFYWPQLERQVRIDGTVTKTSREESQRYFHSRPVGSQLGAWASRQSEVIDARQVLEARLHDLAQRYRDGEIPLPPHWGGYLVKPDAIEFWQGRPNRLHDRFRYLLKADGAWQIDRLAP